MWSQGGINQTRWVPFVADDLLDDSQHAQEDSLDLPPPAQALDRAAPQYGLWSTMAGMATDERLSFMRNQHLAFNCEYSEAVQSVR